MHQASVLAKQQAIYCYLLASFLAVEALPPGLVDASVLHKHGILAETMALVRMERAESHFFEQLGDGEWRDGFRLPAVEPRDRDGDADEWLATFAVTRLIDRTLTWGVDDDDLPIFYRAEWQETW
jgi:hypothetical protein